MKVSTLAAAALSCGLTSAHPRHAFPRAAGYNTTSTAVLPVGTGTANCTSNAGNSTTWDAAATSRNSTDDDCDCTTTAFQTTTLYVFSPDEVSNATTTDVAKPTTTSDGNTFYFSVVNGTTKWEGDRTPPPGISTTHYLTSTFWVLPPEVTSTAITLTATTRRTLTSTLTTDSSVRTSTIVVVETLATTTHITRPSATGTGLVLSTTADGAADSASTTLTVVASASTDAPAGSAGEVTTTLTSAESEQVSTATGSANTVASSVTALGSGSVSVVPSTETGETITVTSSHFNTVVISGSSFTTIPETEATPIITSASALSIPPTATSSPGFDGTNGTNGTVVVTSTRANTITLIRSSSSVAPSQGTVPIASGNETVISTLNGTATGIWNTTVATAWSSAFTATFGETVATTSTRFWTLNGTDVITSATQAQETVVLTSSRNVTITRSGSAPGANGTAGIVTFTSSRVVTLTTTRSAWSATQTEETTVLPSSPNATLSSSNTSWLPGSTDETATITVTSSRNISRTGTRSMWAPSQTDADVTVTSSRNFTVLGSRSSSSTRPAWTSTQDGSSVNTGSFITTFPSLSPTGTAGITYTGVGSGTTAGAGVTIESSSLAISTSTSPLSLSSVSTEADVESTASILNSVTSFPSLSPTGTAGITYTGVGSGTMAGTGAVDEGSSPLTATSTLPSSLSSVSTDADVQSTSGTSDSISSITPFPSFSPSGTAGITFTGAGSGTAGFADTTDQESSDEPCETETLTVSHPPATVTTTVTEPASVSAAQVSSFVDRNSTLANPAFSSASATSVSVNSNVTASTLSTVTRSIPWGVLPPWSIIPSFSATSLGTEVNATAASVSSTSVEATTSPGYAVPTPPYPTSQSSNGTSGSRNMTMDCGETGPFTINWDDQPMYVQDTEDDPPYAPVFNPYHHLFFANGFSYYAPDFSLTNPGTYDPVSGPNVAIYRVDPSKTIDDRDDRVGKMMPGQIGAGPRAYDQTYWFDASSASLGCDNGGSAPCNMTISGYTWNEASQSERKTVVQYAQIAPCNQLEDCILEHVDLNGFTGLSSIRFEAIVDGATLKSWVIDNLNVAWFDNSCEAGVKRASVKK